jgi:hypothetical protein
MKRSRLFLGLVGAAVFLLGVAIVVAPSTAGVLPVDAAVELFGGPYVFVAAFGVAAFVVVLAVMLARAIDGLDESTPPDPEDVYRVPQPGHRFDTFVEGGGSVGRRVFGSRHEGVRQRIQQTAIATLVRAEGLTRSEAETAVSRGTWTDDEVAAAFLAKRRTPSATERLVAAIRGQSAFQQGARRAALEIARVEEGGR